MRRLDWGGGVGFGVGVVCVGGVCWSGGVRGRRAGLNQWRLYPSMPSGCKRGFGVAASFRSSSRWSAVS